MGRSVEQIVRDQLGSLLYRVAQLSAEVEQLSGEVDLHKKNVERLGQMLAQAVPPTPAKEEPPRVDSPSD